MQLTESAPLIAEKMDAKIYGFLYQVQFDWSWVEIHTPAVFLYWQVFSLLAELNCIILFFHLTYRETLGYSPEGSFTGKIIARYMKDENTHGRVDLHFSLFWRIGSLFNTI